MNSFEIVPYQGVGQLKFGMSQTDVFTVIGAPEMVDHDDDEIREYRRENGLQTVYSQETDKLVEIGLSRNIIELGFDGLQLFVEDPIVVLKHLVKLDPNPYELHGFVVFLGLGMTLTGFHDGTEEQKAITIFERGRWDAMKSSLRKFSLK